MTTTALDTPSTTHAEPSHVGRIRLVAVALAASAVTVATLVLTHPWGDRLDSTADTVLTYDFVVDNHADAWPAMLADLLAYGLLTFCLALGVAHLVRGRGRVVATVGAVLVTIGGLLFAMGGMAFTTVMWFMGTLSEDSGRELVDLANDDVPHLLGVEMAGFFLITLGTLVLSAALFRARAVPRPAVVLFVVLTLGLFAGLSGTAMNVVQAAQVLLTGAVAIPLWVSTRDSR